MTILYIYKELNINALIHSLIDTTEVPSTMAHIS